MPSSLPKLQAYLAPWLWEKYLTWKDQQGLASHSEAVSRLLQIFFGGETEQPSKESQDNSLIIQKIKQFEHRYRDLEHRCQDLEAFRQEASAALASLATRNPVFEELATSSLKKIEEQPSRWEVNDRFRYGGDYWLITAVDERGVLAFNGAERAKYFHWKSMPVKFQATKEEAITSELPRESLSELPVQGEVTGEEAITSELPRESLSELPVQGEVTGEEAITSELPRESLSELPVQGEVAITGSLSELITNGPAGKAQLAGLTGVELGKRLGIHSSQITKRRKSGDFQSWTSRKDPDRLSWYYEPTTKKYFFEEEKNTEE